MAQKQLEEKIDANKIETSMIRVENHKIPKMEESMKSLSKSVEQLNEQAYSQQRSFEEMKKLLTDLLTEIAQSGLIHL